MFHWCTGLSRWSGSFLWGWAAATRCGALRGLRVGLPWNLRHQSDIGSGSATGGDLVAVSSCSAFGGYCLQSCALCFPEISWSPEFVSPAIYRGLSRALQSREPVQNQYPPPSLFSLAASLFSPLVSPISPFPSETLDFPSANCLRNRNVATKDQHA